MRGGPVIDLRRSRLVGDDARGAPSVTESQHNADQNLSIFHVDTKRNRALIGEAIVKFTPKQVEVLAVLAVPGVHSCDEFWAIFPDAVDQKSTLRSYIQKLRRKLARHGFGVPCYISRGYELVKECS